MRKPSTDSTESYGIPRIVVIATGMLVLLVAVMAYALSKSHLPAANHATAAASVPAGYRPNLPAGFARPPASGFSGGDGGAVSDPEFDARLARQLRRIDVEDDRSVYRFLEVNGADEPPRNEDDRDRVVAALFRLRSHPDAFVRGGALASLSRVQETALWTDPFLPCLEDPEAVVRREAVRGVTHHHLEIHWRFLVPFAKDADPGVRAAVARALGDAAPPEARDALVRLFADSSDDVVQAAAETLARRVTETPPTGVFEAATCARPRVRISALRVLGAAHTPECYTPIAAALASDTAWAVRREAVRQIAQFDGELAVDACSRITGVARDGARPRSDRFEALQTLAHTAAAPDLDAIAAVAASDPDPALRLAAARTLLARSDARSCATLLALLDAPIGPQCDDEDRRFVGATAAATLRTVSGASFLDSDIDSWRKALPGIESRVRSKTFSYSPEYLPERW